MCHNKNGHELFQRWGRLCPFPQIWTGFVILSMIAYDKSSFQAVKSEIIVTVGLRLSSVSAETTEGPGPGLARADELINQALPAFWAHQILK